MISRSKYYFRRKKRSCCFESVSVSESAEKVGSNDDLITEILVYLPLSSLLSFKSVSKHWLSLISSPDLYHLRLRIPHPIRIRPSGLCILISNFVHPQYKYMPLDKNSSEQERPFLTLSTFPTSSDDHGITRVIQSCNGLLFCCSDSSSSFYSRKHFVYNPTTRHFTAVPLPPMLTGKFSNYQLTDNTALAFDPSRSPHYKLIYHCVGIQYRQIMVYSSETQLWRSVCRDQPLMDQKLGNGVYLNGAVYWMSWFSHTSIYLKIDQERLETYPMPLKLKFELPNYFGQSGGLLHLVMTTTNYGRDYDSAVFDVYEMEKDCSKWCLRYKVELGDEVYSWDWDYSKGVEIVGIVRGERQEDSFLLFNIPLDDEVIMFMKYKLSDKTLKMLFRIVAPPKGQLHRQGLKFFEYIQSLSPV